MNRFRSAAVAALVCLFGCEAEVSTPTPATSHPNISEPHALHGLGAATDPNMTPIVRTQSADDALSGPPDSYDLSQFNPPVGDQSWIGSCVPWSMGWTYSGWLARQAGQGEPRFAPMYLYSQVAAGNAQRGMALSEAFSLLQAQGIASWDLYDSTVPSHDGNPSAGFNFTDDAYTYAPLLPDAAQHRISDFKFEASGSYTCSGSPGATAAIKNAISSGRPVVYAFPVYSEFDAYGSGSAPVPVPATTSTSRGLHAVFASKYDESGLWIQNQWGTGWGRSGWGILSWDFVEQCTYQAGSMSGPVSGAVTNLSARITAPQSGSTVSGVVTMALTTTDGRYPAEGVRIDVDGTTVGYATLLAPHALSYALDTTKLANGQHQVVAVVFETGGTTASSDPITLSTQNQGTPQPTVLQVSFASPAENAWLRGTSTVTVNATLVGSQAQVASIEVSVDQGKSLTKVEGQRNFTLDTTLLADGAHTLFATATASDGSRGTANRTFFSDNTPPNVSLSVSGSGDVVSGTVTLTAQATDAQGAVGVVRFYANGNLLGSAQGSAGSATPGFTYTWDTTTAVDGTYALTAQAVDASGNTGTSTALAVTVKNTVTPVGPTLSIVSPVGGATLSGTALITAAATDDAALTRLTLFVDGQLISSKENPTDLGWVWDTTVSADGAHVLHASATDASGRSFDSADVQVTTANAGLGLTAQYFDNLDFTGTLLTRTDATLNFNWGLGAPDPSMGADTFSVRWSGQLVAPQDGAYTLYTESDDGIRVWVDGAVVIDNFTDHATTENAGVVQLKANTPVSLRVDYFENGGYATAQLLWQGPGLAKQVVPRSALRQAAAPISLVVVASGTPVAGVYPEMALDVGSTRVATWNVTAQAQQYLVQVPAELARSGNVRVSFLNDAYDPPKEDRNLDVLSVTLGGKTWSSSDPTAYESSCQAGFLQSGWLYCNGYVEFPTVSPIAP